MAMHSELLRRMEPLTEMSAHIRPCGVVRICASCQAFSIRSRQEVGDAETFTMSRCPKTHRMGGAWPQVPNDGLPRVARRKLKDLEQGSLTGPPLPQLEAEDAPQYPTTIQGARNNMIKFDKCLILTRVGNFYEVSYSRPCAIRNVADLAKLYFEQAEEFAALLNLKLAQKKTMLGPVSMAGFPFWQLDRFLKILVQDLNKYVAISEEFRIDYTVDGPAQAV